MVRSHSAELTTLLQERNFINQNKLGTEFLLEIQLSLFTKIPQCQLEIKRNFLYRKGMAKMDKQWPANLVIHLNHLGSF
jgi:hypothetical protein